MKNSLLIFTALLPFLFSGCCNKVDCVTGDFKIIRFTDQVGTDLINSQQLSLDSVAVTPLLINPGGHNPRFQVINLANQDYQVYLEANENTAGFVLQLKPLPLIHCWSLPVFKKAAPAAPVLPLLKKSF